MRHHVGLEDPRAADVDRVCLRHVLPQAQKDTSRATTASRLRSLTALHDGSSPLKRAQQHKARVELRIQSLLHPVSYTHLTLPTKA